MAIKTLVLSRRLRQSIIIADCKITIVRIGSNAVRMMIEADESVEVDREEVWIKKAREQGK